MHGKNTYYERKRRKNGTDQHDKDQQQTEKGLTISHLECSITEQTRKPSYYDEWAQEIQDSNSHNPRNEVE
jgi:hypothetical protein